MPGGDDTSNNSSTATYTTVYDTTNQYDQRVATESGIAVGQGATLNMIDPGARNVMEAAVASNTKMFEQNISLTKDLFTKSAALVQAQAESNAKGMDTVLTSDKSETFQLSQSMGKYALYAGVAIVALIVVTTVMRGRS